MLFCKKKEKSILEKYYWQLGILTTFLSSAFIYLIRILSRKLYIVYADIVVSIEKLFNLHINKEADTLAIVPANKRDLTIEHNTIGNILYTKIVSPFSSLYYVTIKFARILFI